MTDSIKLLKAFNYDLEASQIFNYLLTKGLSTVLEISEGTDINRMNVYRKADELVKSGFLRASAEYKTTKYELASIESIQGNVKILEESLSEAKTTLKEIEEQITQKDNFASEKIKVIHYSGKEQIKQLLWNALSARTEILSFGYRTLSEITGKQFIQKWWDSMVERKIENRIILNPGTATIKNKIEKNETKDIYVHNPSQKIWQPRELQKEIINITQETFLYNNVYATIQWDDDIFFGVEIYNQKIAAMERQIFETFWKLGKNLPV